MSRAVDGLYFKYSVNSAMESGIQVKCSKCKVRFTADLRVKPSNVIGMSQSDHLPTFMKTAKNRERIVKLLKKMQEK